MEDCVDKKRKRDVLLEKLQQLLQSAAQQLPPEHQRAAQRLLRSQLLFYALQQAAEEWLCNEQAFSVQEQGRQLVFAKEQLLRRYPVSIDLRQKLWELADQWLGCVEKLYGLTLDRTDRPVLETDEGGTGRQ